MSFFESFLEQLQCYGRQSCMEGDGRSYTYQELLQEIDHWRLRFDELNTAPGTVIAARADYSLEAVAVLLALFSRRAIAALIPRVGDTAQYLLDAHATMLIQLSTDGCECRPLSHPSSHPLLEQLRATQDGGMIIFTSGSSGPPKAALQSSERFLSKFRKPGRRFRTLAFLLFDHVAGLDTLFYTLASGGTLIVTRRRDPRSILQLIASHRVEVLPTSPSFLRLLCATRQDHEHDLSSLKIITYGSEPMDPGTLSRLNTLFPNVQLIQKYGTTETGSPRSISRSNESLWLKIDSGHVETKVIDNTLWIRSEGTILGYLNAPSPIDAEGWYCTGDLVDVDGEWIRFLGRVTEIINVGGEKVTPTEVEQTILELSFVRDALVTGEPHVLMGQVVTARVVLTTAANADLIETAKRIRLHCKDRLAPYKVPVRVDIVADNLFGDRQKAQRRPPPI